MAKLFANSGSPDQTPRSAVSDVCTVCQLPYRVSRLKWDDMNIEAYKGRWKVLLQAVP